MKFSNYNIIRVVQDKIALYNSFTSKVILIEPKIKELLDTIGSADELEKLNPSFFYYLIRHKFIVDNNVDEVAEILKIRQLRDENPSEFILFVNPTLDCNFNCWYCYEKKVKGSKIDCNTQKKIEKFTENLFQTHTELKQFTLSFFGGEPLLYFNECVVPIINETAEKCKKINVALNVNFTTNAYLINKELVEYFNAKKLFPNFQITLDGSKTDHNKTRHSANDKDSYTKIVDNIKLLVKNNFSVRVRINYTDKNIVQTCEIINDIADLPQKLKDNYLIFDFQRVWQNEVGENIDKELHETIAKFKEAGLNVTHKNLLNNMLDICYADKRNSVVINYNGDVFKCTARDFTKDNREGFLDDNGNIVWNEAKANSRKMFKHELTECYDCKIFPICFGGCSQQVIESQDEHYCLYSHNQEKIERIVLDKIQAILA